MKTKRNKFSVLIPFRNEGDELIRTVQSARQTAGNAVDIVIVDDCSDDGRDYESELRRYNITSYTRTPERIGSSAGKELCVENCETPYFIILDAHCRFYTENWLQIAEKVLKADPNSVYCCKLTYFNDETDHQGVEHTSAYGGFFNYNHKTIFSIGWVTKDFTAGDPNKLTQDVPAILGANYLSSKAWWQRINGYKGLRLYGREESFISRKSLMVGGGVKCITKIHTGHKTRREGIPYSMRHYEVVHNELAIAFVCCNDTTFERVRRLIMSQENKYVLRDAIALFDSHVDELRELRDYHRAIAVHDYEYCDLLNAEFQIKIGFSHRTQRKKVRLR